MRWFEENKDRPTPAAPAVLPPYNVEDAAQVQALMARLRLRQADVARAIGVKQGSLSQWRGGRDTHLQSTVTSGAAAVRWFEAR